MILYINYLMKMANEYRANIDATELTKDDIKYLEDIRQKFVTKK